MPKMKTAAAMAVNALILLLLVGAQSCSRQSEKPVRPGARNTSVILITMDTLRADVLGCYGAPFAHTDTLDALAADGAVFLDATSVAFGTTPSHASIMTSKYAAQHGVRDNQTPLATDTVTIAGILKARGYSTAGFVSGYPVSKTMNLHLGFDRFDDRMEKDYYGIERRAALTSDAVLEWLASREAGRPFFLWIHYFDPHSRYFPPKKYRLLFLPADDLVTRFRNSIIPDGGSGTEGNYSLPYDKYFVTQRAYYYGEVAYMDHETGRVIRALKDMGIYDESLIIAVADHGETLEESGREIRFAHSTVHEEVARVPLLVKLPGGAARGTVSRAPVCTLDILPTIMESLGAGADAGGFEGRSLIGLSSGIEDGAFSNRPIFFQAANREGEGVKIGQFKYFSQKGEKLFNLKVDSSEQYNLMGAGLAQEQELKSMVAGWLDSLKSTADRRAPVAPDPETVKKLRQLGYIQ